MSECHSSPRMRPDWPLHHQGHWGKQKNIDMLSQTKFWPQALQSCWKGSMKTKYLLFRTTVYLYKQTGVTSVLRQYPDCHSVWGDRSADGKESSSVCPLTLLLNCNTDMCVKPLLDKCISQCFDNLNTNMGKKTWRGGQSLDISLF